MFKNRALHVQMVNTKNQPTSDESATRNLDPEKINQIVKDQTKNIAIAAGSVYAVSKVLNTVSEIAILAAKAKFR